MARQRTVFVSCGQLTEAERELGRTLARIIEGRGMRAFFAQDVHSAGDLNSEVFRAIQACDAFLAILQRRGEVRYASFPPIQRSSVWIQQEVAIFCYRMFLEQRSLPIRVYSERGILREGVMNIAVVNPIEFDRDDEVLAGVDTWLKGREFDEHPVLARRDELFQSRIAGMKDDHLLLLELLAAHCDGPDDWAYYYSVRDDFYAVLRRAGLADPQIDERLKDAYAAIHSHSLVYGEKGGQRIWIAKQWYQSILDELRNRGRRI